MLRRALILTAILSFPALLGACSIYKSSVRRDFESQSLDRVSPSAIETCDTLSAAESWLQREFPPAETELLIASPQIEVWKSYDQDGRIVLRTLRPTEEGTQICSRIYETEEDFENDSASSLDIGPFSHLSP